MKFDKKSPYGTVYGSCEIAYEQNGHQFRPDETLFEAGKQRETLTLKPQAEQWAKAPRE